MKNRWLPFFTVLIVTAVCLFFPTEVSASSGVYQPGGNRFNVDVEMYLGGRYTSSYKTDANVTNLVWYTNHPDIIQIETNPASSQCTVTFKQAGYAELILSVSYTYSYASYTPVPGGIGSWSSDRMTGVNEICHRITVKDPLPPNNTTDFAGGSGTAEDPYLISTPQHLMNIDLTEPYMYAHYKLINDIVFSRDDFEEGGAFYNNGIGWFPIGTLQFLNNQQPFYGVFDGDGYTISRLETYLSYPRSAVGLFAANGGTIKNLGIVDGVFMSYSQTNTSYNWVGCVAGINTGEITNCYARSNILAGDVVGAICGANQQRGEITDCYTVHNRFTATPDSAYPMDDAGGFVGGIVGYLSGGRVDRVYGFLNLISAFEHNNQFYYPSMVGAIAGAVDEGTGEVSLTNAYYSAGISRDVYFNWVENDPDAIKTEKLEPGQMSRLASFNTFSSTVWYIDPDGTYPYPQLYTDKNLQRVLFVSSKPTKTIYAKGDNVDLSGAELTEIFTDGSSEVLSLSDMHVVYGAVEGVPDKNTVYVTGYDRETTGMQILSLYYRDLTAYVEVYVYEGNLTQKTYAPTANPAGGFITAGESVTLSVPDGDTFICYTTDGSTPTIYSTVYTEPIVLTQDTTIRAITAKIGAAPSEITTARYRVVPDTSYAAMLVTQDLSEEAGKLSGSVTAQVYNGTGATYASTEIIFSIRDAAGKMVYIEKQNKPLAAGITSVSFDGINIALADAAAYTAHLFVWDTHNAMRPLSDADSMTVWEG